MRKGKLLVIAGVLTVIGLLLASCGPAAEQPATGGPTTEQPATGQPTTGQTVTGQPAAGGPRGEVTVALTTSGMRKMCDVNTSTTISGGNIKQLLYDSLIWIDSNSKVQPALAESWKIADDWSRIDFTLRQGIKWPNGDPFTAKDVEFTIVKRLMDTMYHYSGDFKRFVKEVKIVDDYHVSIYVNMPFLTIFDRMNDTGCIYPKDYFEKVGADGFAAAPMGLGSFKVIDFKQDQFLNVEAVVDHYRQTPYLEKLHIVFAPERTTQLAMIKTGEADIITPELALIPDVLADPKLRLSINRGTSGSALCLHDMMKPNIPTPFHDLRVRQAASLAIDRETMCEKVFYGLNEPASQIYQDYNFGYDPTLPVLPYDPVKAKQLLAEAGYPNGFDTTYTYSMATKTESEATAAYLSAVGIRARQAPMEAGAYTNLRNTTARNPAGATSLSGLTIHLNNYAIGMVHPGAVTQSSIAGGSLMAAGLCNAEEVALVDKMLNYNVGDPKLFELAQQLNKLVLANAWRAPLWVVHTPWVFGPRIGEYQHTPGKGFNIRYIDIKLK
ncbi:MAG: ABC transporter substrate-binding protein [Chloroflexota bacterium]